MDATGWALAELEALEADLCSAERHLATAEPTVWRSAAATRFRTRLAEVRLDVHRLRAVAESARPAVVAATRPGRVL